MFATTWEEVSSNDESCVHHISSTAFSKFKFGIDVDEKMFTLGGTDFTFCNWLIHWVR